jgi:exosome complex component RRP43
MASTINIASFYREHIRHGVRPNGRKLLRARSVVADAGSTVSTADGSALIRMGSTVVLASVQCEPIAPQPDETEPEGRIVVSLEMPAICSPTASAGQGGSGGSAASAIGRWGKREREKAVLVELLQHTASEGLVDLSRLIVVEGHSAWSCCCDMVVIEDDGNLTDAALLAMMTALSRVRLPHCTLDEDSGGLLVTEERAIPLCLSLPLYPCSFAMVEGAALLDPCAEEETHASTCFTLMLDAKGAMRALHKPGGAPLPEGVLPECLQAAQQRLPCLTALVASSAGGGE